MPVDLPDRALIRLARNRHGVVTVAELAEVGVSRHALAHRVRTGWLRRMYRGVYLVGPLEVPQSRAMAATLAVGDGALLSHYPAAVLWGLRPPVECPMHVTVVGRETRDRRGLSTHRVSHLHPQDATRRQSIPVTSPARTLLDLATHLPQRDLARAVEEAQVHRLATDSCLNEQSSRYPRHPGIARLKHAVRTDLIVEVDGYAFHSNRAAFERDRRRDAELGALGYRVLRVTWRQIADEPEAVVATLAVAYGQRSLWPR
jgi:hypothetical protein